MMVDQAKKMYDDVYNVLGLGFASKHQSTLLPQLSQVSIMHALWDFCPSVRSSVQCRYGMETIVYIGKHFNTFW